MAEDFGSEPLSTTQTKTNLRQLAAALREADHLDVATQKSVASLLDELNQELETSGMTSQTTAHLAAAISEVARSLHQQKPTGELETARDQLKDAAAQAEVDAPVATGLVYQFIDLLASIGI